MKVREVAEFVLLISIAVLALLVPGEGWPVAAQSPQPASCPTSFEWVRQWGSIGSGPGQFKAPVAVAVDLDGNVHVADKDNGRIQKFDPHSNYLLEYGIAVLLNPNGVEVGPNGYMYVADTGFSRIRYYDNAGTFIGAWNDSSCGSQCDMRDPWGVAGWDYGGTTNVYVVDRFTCGITRFSSAGSFIGKWGSSCSSVEWLLSKPQDIATPPVGNFPDYVYIADTGNHRIAKYDYRLEHLSNWGSIGSGNSQFNQPSSVATDAEGCVYVADTGNHRIQVFDDQGGFVTKFGSQGSGNGQFQSPRGVAVDADGCVYMADTGNNRVVVFCPQSSSLPPNQTDAFIRDNFTDVGTLPSNKPWWESPDIWIRHAPDNQEFPETPILGQTNYIYVRVHNLGDIPLENVEAAVYCAPPSEATPWPDAWAYIGSTDLSGIAPQGEKTGYLLWNPDGTCSQILENYNHMCLLVRLVTDQDPIQNEGSIPWDNNIAQLNVHQFENWPGSGNLNVATVTNEDVSLMIGNPFDTFQMADVEFDRGDFPVDGQVEVYLNETLFDQWQSIGGTVEGGTVDLVQKKVEITSTSIGMIKNLPLEAKQQFSTTMRVATASDQFFPITVSELINGEYVGGNLYTTRFASQAEAIKLSATADIMPPNSTQTISAAVFGPGKIPVKDGAIINFSTTLGTITPSQTSTINGMATVQLAPGETPGTAQVSADVGSTVSKSLEISIGNLVYLPLVAKDSP